MFWHLPTMHFVSLTIFIFKPFKESCFPKFWVYFQSLHLYKKGCAQTVRISAWNLLGNEILCTVGLFTLPLWSCVWVAACFFIGFCDSRNSYCHVCACSEDSITDQRWNTLEIVKDPLFTILGQSNLQDIYKW